MRAKHCSGYWLEWEEMQKNALALLSANMKRFAKEPGKSDARLSKYLSDHLGTKVSRGLVSGYSNGNVWPGEDRLTLIAQFYGVKVYQLFLEEQTEPTGEQLLAAAGLKIEKLK